MTAPRTIKNQDEHRPARMLWQSRRRSSGMSRKPRLPAAAFHLPEQHEADRNQADGVEKIGGAQQRHFPERRGTGKSCNGPMSRLYVPDMTTGIPWHLPKRISALVVLGVALLATLVLGTAAPHLHLDREPAFFNEEHDLTLLASASRSEEHTSELQSQSNLVCRLLLE